MQQPTLHNPFPQISRVGVAPFFNLSSEPKLNGHKVAEAYAAELAEVPGYDVISVSVVETTALAYQLDMNRESDARRLAQILDIDAIVTGAVTEYTPYYPPRMTLTVAWYAANPNFHPIPAGYGLPWEPRLKRTFPAGSLSRRSLPWRKSSLKRKLPIIRKCRLTGRRTNRLVGSPQLRADQPRLKIPTVRRNRASAARHTRNIGTTANSGAAGRRARSVARSQTGQPRFRRSATAKRDSLSIPAELARPARLIPRPGDLRKAFRATSLS